MAYVQQVCDGYSKRSLMGNWMEERLYPPQPFRENLNKEVPLIPYSQDPKTKPSQPSTALPSSALFLVSNGEPSGKHAIVLYLTTALYLLT